ncbi:hypothetical protein [Metabacillus fastidiosus]
MIKLINDSKLETALYPVILFYVGWTCLALGLLAVKSLFELLN